MRSPSVQPCDSHRRRPKLASDDSPRVQVVAAGTLAEGIHVDEPSLVAGEGQAPSIVEQGFKAQFVVGGLRAGGVDVRHDVLPSQWITVWLEAYAQRGLSAPSQRRCNGSAAFRAHCRNLSDVHNVAPDVGPGRPPDSRCLRSDNRALRTLCGEALDWRFANLGRLAQREGLEAATPA
jgi:hypothetical protein